MNSESNRIEYKQELNDSLEKEIVAFLNYKDGGVIYIGISKNKEIIGIADSDSIQLKIKDRIKNNICPSTMGLFDIITETIYNKEIIKITVASGSEKPYYLAKLGMSPKGCYVRVGSASEPMTHKMIEDLFARRIRNSIGNIKSRNQDLSFEQLKIYYGETLYNLNDKFAENLELLTEDGKYNYAAYLLSDINGMSIKFAKYAGTDRVNLIENEEYGFCSLIKATKALLEKFKVENITFSKITASGREERKLLHPVALREAIINAIIHNNYSNEIPPKFEFFSDRLEITSTGGIPSGFDEEEFFMGYSVPQNKELMWVFRDLDLVEQLGSGVPRILDNYSRKIYNFSPNFIRVVMPFTESFERSAIKKAFNNILGIPLSDLKPNSDFFQLGGNSILAIQLVSSLQRDMSISVSDVLNLRTVELIESKIRNINIGSVQSSVQSSVQIIALMKNNPKITAQKIAIELGITIRAVEKNIAILKKSGQLKRIGPSKSGNWIVIEEKA